MSAARPFPLFEFRDEVGLLGGSSGSGEESRVRSIVVESLALLMTWGSLQEGSGRRRVTERESFNFKFRFATSQDFSNLLDTFTISY